MTGRRQAEQSEITALVTDLSLYSHLSLWHGQVEVVEDLQLAVRPAHISALDRKVLPSSRQSGLQVSLHVPVLQLQERKYRKKISRTFLTIITGRLYQDVSVDISTIHVMRPLFFAASTDTLMRRQKVSHPCFLVTTPNIMTGLRDIFQHCFLATEPNKPLPDPSGFRALPSPILFS